MTPSEEPPPAEDSVAGIPYDWRQPTRDRIRSRAWNPEDPRFFTPKTFGWGYGINFYWLIHPMRYLRGKSGR
ncbi:MAG TPA: DUF5808 domain-containing protein [Pseudonocardiaceae bacterium]|jgi:hypothetical protein|nr:DUF5808 domain-containing protein [Pseudonocardiaceae bacterium]